MPSAAIRLGADGRSGSAAFFGFGTAREAAIGGHFWNGCPCPEDMNMYTTSHDHWALFL